MTEGGYHARYRGISQFPVNIHVHALNNRICTINYTVHVFLGVTYACCMVNIIIATLFWSMYS